MVVPHPGEVAEIIEIPLAYMLRADSYRLRRHPFTDDRAHFSVIFNEVLERRFGGTKSFHAKQSQGICVVFFHLFCLSQYICDTHTRTHIYSKGTEHLNKFTERTV